MCITYVCLTVLCVDVKQGSSLILKPQHDAKLTRIWNNF
jgi:hypothetical protein